jgi:hypothetical protein
LSLPLRALSSSDTRPLKSAAPTPSPSTSETPSQLAPSVGFSLVGQGWCRDSNGNYYDYIDLVYGQINDANAAIDWCLTATAYASSLVGVEIEIFGATFTCLYDNGSINDIQTTDFSPPAYEYYRGFRGTGAVAGTYYYSVLLCYKNEVRRINSNCMISFLIFSHGVPNF